MYLNLFTMFDSDGASTRGGSAGGLWVIGF